MRRFAARSEIERLGVDVVELDFTRQHGGFPGFLLAVPSMELRHHFAREELKARADVLVGILAGLIEQNDLVDVGAFEFLQPFADGVRRADQLAAGTLLTGRRLFPLLVAVPEVHRAGFERPFLVVKLQRELEERPTVGFCPRLVVGGRAHEARHDGDIRIGLVVRQLLEVAGEGVVVRVHPRAGGIEAHELEAQRAHAAMRGVLDRIELGAGHPQWWMRLLQGFGHDRTQRKLEEFAIVFPAVVPEHRQRAAHGVLPDLAFVAEAEVEGVQLGHRGAFAQPQFDAAVGDQIEGGDLFRDPGRVVGGHLYDAVTQADVLGALTRSGQEDLGR